MSTTQLLSSAFGALRPAAPIREGALTIVPFTTTYEGGARFVLLEAAMDRGGLVVTEVDGGGSVPHLKAVNKGPWPVLIFDGEELVGAKQNRIVNTTILVGVGETILPVSCVEQGRWSARSKVFAAGSHASHPELRRRNEAYVRAALLDAERYEPHSPSAPPLSQAERAGRYRSDQGQVWHEVRDRSVRMGVSSATGAMADAYEQRASDLERLRAAFLVPEKNGQGESVPVDGMVAAAVFLGGRFLCFDALWPAKRFAQLYPKLLLGYALEAMQGSTARRLDVDPESVMLRVFAALSGAEPSEHPGVDLGVDVRIESPGAVGAGLVYGRQLVQLSLFPRENA